MEPDPALSSRITYEQVERAAQDVGLEIMGAQLSRESGAKELQDGTLILLGTGASFWPVMKDAPEWLDKQPHPIDRWSTRIVGALGEALRAQVFFPFGGPPYTPFIDWALKSGRTFSSPVGALVHDTVGMMISFRGALHFPYEMEIPSPSGASPCTDCPAPCTTSCPVEALNTHSFYNVEACHSFLDRPEGASCMSQGCKARLACPLSAGAGRDTEQTAHHMKAFHPS